MREGWELKTLSDVSDVRDGTHDSPKYQEEGYALITSKNLKNGKLTYDKIKYISEEDYININKRSKVDVGDILFAMIGTIGNPVIIEEEPNYAIKNVALFKVYDNYDSSFIKYYFDSSYVVDKMQSEAKGTTQKFVGLGYLRKFPIVVPSLKEQKQIVTTLDKAFKQIDQAKVNLEKNLNNAKELFQSKLNEVFSQSGEGWEEKSLAELSTKITDGVHKKPNYTDSGIPFIKINNLTKGDSISFENVSYISEEDHLEYCKRTKPEKGDILITKDGTIGIVRVIDTDIEFSIFVSVALIKPIVKEHTPYLKYVLISPLIQDQIKPQGTALKHLYLRDLRKFVIPVPPLDEQEKIVHGLEVLEQNTKKLETHYQQKLNNLEELKKSILQKAFKGELAYK